jgi:lipid II:glycine glycyltransferase (peptidoglycan interpeptide bridge formation enzyme)
MQPVTADLDAGAWNRVIAPLPGAHILQTRQWAQVKARFGWEPLPRVWYGNGDRIAAAALVLRRRIPLAGFAARLSVLYVPKGPLLCDWGDGALRARVLADLRALARNCGGIFIKIDPDVRLGKGIPGEGSAREDPLGRAVTADLLAYGWHFSAEQVQFRNTVLIDLAPSEEQLLARMKAKTRYNIGLARRKGVTVRHGGLADLDLLYRMYAETSVRDRFVIREEAYYRQVWREFLQAGMAALLIAEVSGEPVAAVLVFQFAGRAWYLYGMSRSLHREKMPNHLLQWEAMRWAKAAGCTVYDLWGAPDEFSPDDPLWGVFRFKEGLGGEVVRYLGAWDLPVRPLYYRFYTQILPRLLNRMRRRGLSRTRESLSV